MADGDPWFSMVNSEFSETSLGSAYLSEVTALTSQGCPPPATPATTAPLASAGHQGPRTAQAGQAHHRKKKRSRRHPGRPAHKRHATRKPARKHR